MIYRFDNIKKGILGDTPVTDTFVESNLFVYGLHLLEDSDMMIRKHLLSMYDESKVITEGFIKKIDLKALCKKIIEFFLKTLKDIYGRLKGLVLELFNNDRTIAKYKDQLRHMPDSFDISKYTDIQFHNYSYFEADIPDPNLYLKFSQNYEDSISELQKIAKIESKQEIIAAIMKLEEAVDIQTDSMFFNEIRGSIIGSGKDLHGIIVTAETYPEYLYSLFRNGESMAHIGKMTITKNQVALSCDRFLNSKVLLKKIEKQQLAIEGACNKVTRDFDKLSAAKININQGKTDLDIEYAIDKYIKKKLAQLAEMCNICVMAFSAKSEAIKECAVMDKKICYKAITHILTGDLEEGL